MVQRASKARESAKRTPSSSERKAAAGAAQASAADPAARLAAVEAERDRLKAALESAQGRIAELETARAAVVNRIDWLIDSLGSALEKRA